MKTTRAVLGVVALAAALSPTVHAAGARHRDVLALKPVGFWPADEGEGDRLRDLAETGNHAKVFNTP